jgi:hypothetical protein
MRDILAEVTEDERDDLTPVSKTCEACWTTYEGWRSDSDLCPDCDFRADDEDSDYAEAELAMFAMFGKEGR